MSKKLHLTLSRKWFNMIALGIKKEEYREIKPYWTKRLVGKEYDRIIFRNGYGKKMPEIEIELLNVEIGFGRAEWGGHPYQVQYVLRLGKILNEKNFVRSSDGNIWFVSRKTQNTGHK